MAATTASGGKKPGIRRLLHAAFPDAPPVNPSTGVPDTPMDAALSQLDATLDGLAQEAERLEHLLARARTSAPAPEQSSHPGSTAPGGTP